MQIIVIGCGKVGSRFANILSREGHDVSIVDSDRDAFKSLDPGFNGIMVTGVPIDQDVLKQAGIESADALAAVTPDDNINIMTCQVAKEIFKVPKVIARIYDPSREHVFHQFGLDTICPTDLTVDVIRSMILGERGVSTHIIGSTPVIFRNQKVTADDVGEKLRGISIEEGMLIFGISRKGGTILAHPDIILEKDDEFIIANAAI